MDKQYQGIIYLMITVILFSTFEVTCKMIGPRLHPFQISLYRFLIGGLVLLPFAVVKMKKLDIRMNKEFIVNMLILGFVNIVVSMGLIQFGLLYTNASTAAVIFSGNPLFVALFAAWLLKEKLDWTKTAGMLIGLAGVIILFSDKLNFASVRGLGPVMVLGAAVVFALYTVMGKRLTLKNMDSLVMTSFSFLAGSLLLIPLMIAIRAPLWVNNIAILPHILYLGVLVSGFAYMCYFYGLMNVNTTAGALVYFVKPALAALFAVVLLGEKLTAHFYAGTLIILLGVVVVNIKQIASPRTVRSL